MKKRIISLAMAVIMCISFAGCGKESKKTDKVGKYNAVQQKVIEHTLSDMSIIDETLYAIYNDFDDSTETVKNGLLKFDLNSKETTEIELDNGNIYINNLYLNSESNLVLKGMKYIEDGNSEPSSDENEEIVYSNIEYIYDADLNQLSKNESEPIYESNEGVSGEEMDISTVFTNEGQIVSLRADLKNDNYSIIIKDSNGNEQSVIKLNNMANGLYCLESGKVLVDVWENEKEYLYEVDVKSGKLGKQIADVSKYSVSNAYKGEGDTILFVSNSSLFECDCETGKINKILNFIDCDINSDNINYVFQMSDGTLGIVASNNSYTSTEIDYLYKQDKDAKEKAEITIGILFMDSLLQEEIINYNKSHDNVRIKVKEYYGNDEDDYEKAISKFNSDIASGNCPDIIDFGSSVSNISQYVEKGVIEELTPYFEKDNEIKIEDFVQSVVEAYKINGKLYVLPQEFSINGFFGASSVVGNETGWTVDEFIQLANSFEKGTSLNSVTTRERVMDLLCNYDINKYVDWSKGECYFDKGEFAKILEFSNNYINIDEYIKENEENNVSEVTRIRNKQQILLDAYISSCDEYMVAKEIYGEKITFKGHPSSEGNGVAVDSSGSSLLAISSKSKYKDEAWEFVRQSYLPKVKNTDTDMIMSLPIRQDDLDIILEKAKTPRTYKDENGNEQIDYNIWGFEDIEIKIPYPTDEDIAEIKKIINSADTLLESNDKIAEMVKEESEAFYKGQKSADEVAKVIQSRVSVYVKENR